VGAEVGEELVDHRRLRDERDDAHRAVAGLATERVELVTTGTLPCSFLRA
jgi:hypothetical protein